MGRRTSPGFGLGSWLMLALVLAIIDQITKYSVTQWFRNGESLYVTDFFNLVRVHNSGAAFSFLAGGSGWQRWFFIGIGVMASIFIVWMLRAHATQRLFCLAITLILGGAIGNVVDRIWHGHVVDFIQLHWRGWYFPSFNVADAAITMGAVLLIVDELRRVSRSR